MIGHLLYAVGAPCPTLVLDGRGLNGAGQLSHLAEVRRYLMSAGGEGWTLTGRIARTVRRGQVIWDGTGFGSCQGRWLQ